MNKEFEQWLDEPIPHYDGVYERRRGILPEEVYDYLQANPHLLREDGEKEQSPSIDEWVLNAADKAIENYKAKQNPRPTDEQQMETEAREMLNKIAEQFNYHFFSELMDALTEFGKMWKERGREEVQKVKERGHLNEQLAWAECDKLQQQLAEKDKEGYDAAFITWIGEQGLEYYPKRGGWLYWGSYMSLEKLHAEWKEEVNKSTHG